MEDSSVKKKVGVATKWSFLTELLAKIIVPLTNFILAHLLLPEAFGLVATINMVITFTDVLTESGFGQYVIQHDFRSEKDLKNNVDVAFWCNFTVSTVIWASIFLFRFEIANLVGSSGYEIPLVVACLSIPLTSFLSMPIAILQKRLDYRSLFFNRMAGSLTPLVVSTSLALLDFGYWSLIIGTLCSHLVKVSVLIVRSKWRPHFYFSFAELRQMLGYSIWILLESIVMWATIWVDVLIVSRTFGSYYIGIYKTAQTTVTGILSVITASVNSIMFVTLSKLKNDMNEFRTFFYASQKKLAVFVVPMGVGILVFSKLITYILLGPNWDETSSFLGIWGLCMALVATMGTFCREALRAKGLPKISLIVQSLHLAFIVPVICIAVGYGYDFLIYARSFAYLEVILLLHIFVKRMLQISPIVILKNSFWPAICAAGMGTLGFVLQARNGEYIALSFLVILLCIVFYFALLMIRSDYRLIVVDLLKSITKKWGDK